MVKPGGTGRPARVISASPAPFPPSSSFISPEPCSKNQIALRAEAADCVGASVSDMSPPAGRSSVIRTHYAGCGRRTPTGGPKFLRGSGEPNFPNETKSRSADVFPNERIERLDCDALLVHGVAFAHRHGLVRERFIIDRQAERRPDFVLAAVQLSDVSLVVLRAILRPQPAFDRARAFDQLGLIAGERKDGHLNRRDPRVKVQHHSLRLFTVRIDGSFLVVSID